MRASQGRTGKDRRKGQQASVRTRCRLSHDAWRLCLPSQAVLRSSFSLLRRHLPPFSTWAPAAASRSAPNTLSPQLVPCHLATSFHTHAASMSTPRSSHEVLIFDTSPAHLTNQLSGWFSSFTRRTFALSTRTPKPTFQIIYAPPPIGHVDLAAYARSLGHRCFAIVHPWSASIDALELVVLINDREMCTGNLVGPRFAADWASEFDAAPAHVHDRYVSSTYTRPSKLAPPCPTMHAHASTPAPPKRARSTETNGANAADQHAKNAPRSKCGSNTATTVVKDVLGVARRLKAEAELRAHKCLDFATEPTRNADATRDKEIACTCEWHLCSSSTPHPSLGLTGD